MLSDAFPPRHFWRRFFAFAIDAAIAWLIVVVVMTLIAEDTASEDFVDPVVSYKFAFSVQSGQFRPPISFVTSTCGKSNDALMVLKSHFAPAKIIEHETCIDRSFGIPVSGLATITLADTPEAGDLGGQTVTASLTIETAHRFADALALGVFIALGTLCNWIFGVTPGKKLMLLRIVGRKPIPAFRRELIRALPFLLPVPTFAILNELERGMTELPPQIYSLADALEILSLVAFLALWVWPLLRWQGALFHDRWLGLSVVDWDDLLADEPSDSIMPEGSDQS